MKIKLEVLEGYDAGKVFDLTGQKHYIIGRNAEESQASVELDSRDTHVSRNHCIIEIKQSSCFIIDNCSANGTMIKKNGDTHFQRVKDISKIDDGDILCIGNTIIKIRVNRLDKEIPKMYCLQCGIELNGIQSSQIIGSVSTNLDVYCDNCKSIKFRNQNNIGHDANAEDNIGDRMSQIKFQCLQCGKDVSYLATTDGMAYELYHIISYLCKDCVDKIYAEADSNSRINGIAETKRSRIENFVILSEIGRGGMGVVYKSWQESTGRIVAIKKMLQPAMEDHYALQCFEREIMVQSKLSHSNIVRTLYAGYLVDTREFYLVSEYVNGINASDLLSRYGAPLPEKMVIKIACDVLSALEYAHSRSPIVPRTDNLEVEKGMVHRDIKPSNILITRFGDNFHRGSFSRKLLNIPSGLSNTGIIAKLSDFGIAKWLNDLSLTKTDDPPVGTPVFMSPEQIMNYKYVKPSSDVYSMGVTLYYLVTAHIPFDYDHALKQHPNIPLLECDRRLGINGGKTPKHPLEVILEDERIPIRERNASVSNHLAEIIDNTIKRNLEKRKYTSAGDLKKALQQI